MLSVLGSNAFFLKHTEEVLALQEDHCELLGLCLDVLFEYDIFKELLSRHVLIQQVQHQHHHYFDRFLIKFG